MLKRILEKVAVFHYKMAELLFIGAVLGGVMQTTVPTWKVMIGAAFTLVVFVIAVGFDVAAANQKPS